MLPQAAGYHHYPKPIVDIDHFRFGDFKLFVTDSAGLPAVVVPVSPRGSGDGRVRLLAAHVDSAYFRKLASPPAAAPGPSGVAAHAESVAAAQAGQPGGGEQPDVLPADDPLAQQAFAAQ